MKRMEEMKTKYKTEAEILSCEFITKTDIMMLFHIGEKKARDIFKKVQDKVESEGKLNVPGRISWRRMYKMLGLPIPQIRKKNEIEIYGQAQ